MNSSFKKCEEFRLCCQYGNDKFYVEEHEENKTLYHIIIKGSGRVGKVFDDKYTKYDEKTNNFVDLKKYLKSDLIFQSYTPFHLYGFNTLDKNQDWDGRLVKKSFRGDDKSWLICFKGKPIVNGITMKTMDYAKLIEKDYDVILNEGMLGIFTKI